MAENHRKICKVSQETLLHLSNVSPADATVVALSSLCPFCDYTVAFHDKDSVERVDGEGVKERLRKKRTRVNYDVTAPFQLVHIDGHHKLIRWGLVTHGGIDGGSHVVTYMHCSDNNLSKTVLIHFVNSCRKYQIPMSVRADGGGENVLVCDLQMYHSNLNPHSFLIGSSKSNCKIQALWRNVHNWVTRYFHSLFTQLERDNYLDVDDCRHMFVLHYLFLPVINHELHTVAMEGWNNHPMSTEGNKTPYQLLELRREERVQSPPLDEDYLRQYLMPWHYTNDGSVDLNEDEAVSQVELLPRACPLSDAQKIHFVQSTSPLSEDEHREGYVNRFVRAIQSMNEAIALIPDFFV